ncbi:MAG TPA: hypothetical protein ENK44_13850 [Caldithrix abyssi]|uniref:DUF4424 domain-containing protein n=1 Tax=Caldithrix abyssi TaxID=187145 RepID=A0A7V4U2E4_CALAY|nr:hypothetical protein [Caldithrix abyssi]
MKILFALLCIGGIFSKPFMLAAQPVDFFRENIEIDISDTICTVTGTYYFRNPSSRSLNIPVLYPIVINNRLPIFPEYISVKSVSGNKEIPFSRQKQAIRFNLSCPGQSIIIFQVSYRQRTPFGYMEYILTTTKNWGRALEYAEYNIRLPANLRLQHLSLKTDRITNFGDFTLYYTKKTSFLPAKNIIIKWERSEP